MQAARPAHKIHILQSSQTCGPVSRIECVLISKIVGLSISDAAKATLAAMQPGKLPSKCQEAVAGLLLSTNPRQDHIPVPNQGIEFPFPGPIKDFHSLKEDLIDLVAGISGKIDKCFDLTDTAEIQFWGNMLISGQRLNMEFCYSYISPGILFPVKEQGYFEVPKTSCRLLRLVADHLPAQGVYRYVWTAS